MPRARIDEHRNLGDRLLQDGDVRGGTREFRRVAELQPTNLDARFHLGLSGCGRATTASRCATCGRWWRSAGRAPRSSRHGAALERIGRHGATRASPRTRRRGWPRSGRRCSSPAPSSLLKQGEAHAAAEAFAALPRGAGEGKAPAAYYAFALLAEAAAGRGGRGGAAGGGGDRRAPPQRAGAPALGRGAERRGEWEQAEAHTAARRRRTASCPQAHKASATPSTAAARTRRRRICTAAPCGSTRAGRRRVLRWATSTTSGWSARGGEALAPRAGDQPRQQPWCGPTWSWWRTCCDERPHPPPALRSLRPPAGGRRRGAGEAQAQDRARPRLQLLVLQGQVPAPPHRGAHAGAGAGKLRRVRARCWSRSRGSTTSCSTRSPSTSPSSSATWRPGRRWRRRWCRSSSRRRAPSACGARGRASGEEAYTVSILLQRVGGEAPPHAPSSERVRIVGTDIDRRSLENASRGDYPDLSLTETPARVRERWFSRRPPFRIRPEAQRGCRSTRRDLISEPADGRAEPDLLPQRGDLLRPRDPGAAVQGLLRRAGPRRLPGAGEGGDADRRGAPLFRPVNNRERIFRKPA